MGRHMDNVAEAIDAAAIMQKEKLDKNDAFVGIGFFTEEHKEKPDGVFFAEPVTHVVSYLNYQSIMYFGTANFVDTTTYVKDKWPVSYFGLYRAHGTIFEENMFSVGVVSRLMEFQNRFLSEFFY
jgi:hypothetical protein